MLCPGHNIRKKGTQKISTFRDNLLPKRVLLRNAPKLEHLVNILAKNRLKTYKIKANFLS